MADYTISGPGAAPAYGPPVSLDLWYDRHSQSYVLQTKDADGNQIDEAAYLGQGKQRAIQYATDEAVTKNLDLYVNGKKKRLPKGDKTMKYVYPALFYEEDNGGYTVIFPDFDGMATQGENLVEAMEMAADAAAGRIVIMLEDGDALPAPSRPHDLTLEGGNGHISDVFIDITDELKAKSKKTIKKTLTIPEWVDEAAKDKGINFSQTLVDAILEKIS